MSADKRLPEIKVGGYSHSDLVPPSGYDVSGAIRGLNTGVWRATERSSGTAVALRVENGTPIHSSDLGHSFIRWEFSRELRHAAAHRFALEAAGTWAIRHDDAVRAHSVGVDENCAYIATEFAPGSDLNHILLNRLWVDPETARVITLGVARILASAHADGLHHGLVSPSKVILSPAPGAPESLHEEAEAAQLHSVARMIGGTLVGDRPILRRSSPSDEDADESLLSHSFRVRLIGFGRLKVRRRPTSVWRGIYNQKRDYPVWYFPSADGLGALADPTVRDIFTVGALYYRLVVGMLPEEALALGKEDAPYPFERPDAAEAASLWWKVIRAAPSEARARVRRLVPLDTASLPRSMDDVIEILESGSASDDDAESPFSTSRGEELWPWDTRYPREPWQNLAAYPSPGWYEDFSSALVRHEAELWFNRDALSASRGAVALQARLRQVYHVRRDLNAARLVSFLRLGREQQERPDAKADGGEPPIA